MIVAVGGRPNKLGCPGDELAISSDDLFMLDHPPKKTLLVGASFIALECAGFLHHLGFDVTVMVRSILLRGFDQECANKVGDYMEKEGVKFIRNMVPAELKRLPNGRILVKYQGSGFANGDMSGEEEFDTVVSCVGRYADTAKLGLDALGVKTRRGKILSNCEQTSVPNIYAIGDVLYNKQELTPVAIQAGRLLARRLYGNSDVQMNYDNVPMTVFTPLEYSSVGITEEEAQKQYGGDKFEVYHLHYDTLEQGFLGRVDKKGMPMENQCYSKIITMREAPRRVLGAHILGPNSGEIIQGLALSMKLGATKDDLEAFVPIHPTHGEEVFNLNTTKEQSMFASKRSC